MRFIKTFVLHLYVDLEVPERICGDIRPLDDLKAHSFKDLHDFEKLLLQLANPRRSDEPNSPAADRNR